MGGFYFYGRQQGRNSDFDNELLNALAQEHSAIQEIEQEKEVLLSVSKIHDGLVQAQ